MKQTDHYMIFFNLVVASGKAEISAHEGRVKFCSVERESMDMPTAAPRNAGDLSSVDGGANESQRRVTAGALARTKAWRSISSRRRREGTPTTTTARAIAMAAARTRATSGGARLICFPSFFTASVSAEASGWNTVDYPVTPL